LGFPGGLGPLVPCVTPTKAGERVGMADFSEGRGPGVLSSSLKGLGSEARERVREMGSVFREMTSRGDATRLRCFYFSLYLARCDMLL